MGKGERVRERKRKRKRERKREREREREREFEIKTVLLLKLNNKKSTIMKLNNFFIKFQKYNNKISTQNSMYEYSNPFFKSNYKFFVGRFSFQQKIFNDNYMNWEVKMVCLFLKALHCIWLKKPIQNSTFFSLYVNQSFFYS